MKKLTKGDIKSEFIKELVFDMVYIMLRHDLQFITAVHLGYHLPIAILDSSKGPRVMYNPKLINNYTISYTNKQLQKELYHSKNVLVKAYFDKILIKEDK